MWSWAAAAAHHVRLWAEVSRLSSVFLICKTELLTLSLLGRERLKTADNGIELQLALGLNYIGPPFLWAAEQHLQGPP